MALSPQEFAAKIKQKYPSYANVDDMELTQKIVTKYPQYKSQVNLGDSGMQQPKMPTQSPQAQQFTSNLVKGVATAFNPSKLGENIQNFTSNVAPKVVQGMVKAGYGKPTTPEQTQELESWKKQQEEKRMFGQYMGPSGEEVAMRQGGMSESDIREFNETATNNPINQFVKNTGEAATQGASQAVSGGGRFLKGMNLFDQSQSLQERNANIVGGFSDAISGAIGTAFSPATGAIESLPDQVKQPIQGAMNFAFNEVPVNAVKQFAQLIRPDLDVEDPQFQETVVKPFQAAMQTYLTAGAPGAKAAMKPLTKPIAKGAEKVGGGLKVAGEKLYESAIKPTVKEAELLQRKAAGVPNKTGKTIDVTTRAQTALEKGVWGREKTIGVSALKQSNKLYKEKIAPAIKQSKEVITRDELFAPLEAKIKKTIEPGRKAELQKAFEAIKEEYASPDFSQLSLSKAQKIKQGLDEFTPQKAFKGEEIGSAYNQLRKDLADVIRAKTYNKLKDANIRKDFIDYGNLRELEKVGIKARTASGAKGGFGSFWSSAWDMATTPLKTAGGQVLYRIGNKLEVIGPKNMKTFGQVLQSQGISNASYKKLVRVPKLKVNNVLDKNKTTKSTKKLVEKKKLDLNNSSVDSVSSVTPKKTAPGNQAVKVTKLKSSKRITKELEPLANEARKYASAEEFIDNVLRKSGENSLSSLSDKALKARPEYKEWKKKRAEYMVKKEDLERQFMGKSRNRDMKELRDDPEIQRMNKEYGEITQWLNNRSSHGVTTEIDQFIDFSSPEISIKKLTDFYKKATKGG